MREMNNGNKTDFLGVQAIASILGLSRHVIYRLCQEGELPFYRVGGNIRVKTEDFEGYMQTCRQVGTKGAS